MTRYSRLRLLRVGAALATASALVLAGCNGGTQVEDPPTTAPTTEAATPTSSPTATEPTDDPTTAEPTEEPTEVSALPALPEEAKENTPEGAEAFIRYYFDVANELLQDPQPGQLITLGIDDCLSCADMEARIKGLADEDQRVRSDVYSVTSMGRVGGGGVDVTIFNMEVELLPTAILESDGSIAQDSGQSTLRGQAAAVWEGGSWSIFDLGLQPS